MMHASTGPFVSGKGRAFLRCAWRTTEEDGEGFVENIGGVRIEDVASLHLPRLREAWRWFGALVTLISRSPSGTHHSLPDTEGFWT